MRCLSRYKRLTVFLCCNRFGSVCLVYTVVRIVYRFAANIKSSRRRRGVSSARYQSIIVRAPFVHFFQLIRPIKNVRHTLTFAVALTYSATRGSLFSAVKRVFRTRPAGQPVPAYAAPAAPSLNSHSPVLGGTVTNSDSGASPDTSFAPIGPTPAYGSVQATEGPTQNKPAAELMADVAMLIHVLRLHKTSIVERHMSYLAGHECEDIHKLRELCGELSKYAKLVIPLTNICIDYLNPL